MPVNLQLMLHRSDDYNQPSTCRISWIFLCLCLLELLERPLSDHRRIFDFPYLKTSAIQRYKKWLIKTRSGSHSYCRFILLSAPRSGSTLLHTYLNSSLNIYSLGEQPWRDVEQGIHTHYFKAYPRLIQAVGFKVFYQFSEQAPYHDLYHELKKDQDLRVIHLVRENTLEQYLSEKLAWQNREWTLKEQSANQEKIELDLQEFEAFIAMHRAQQKRCLEDFKSHNLLTLSYESLTEGAQPVLEEVQDFLEIPKKKLFTVLKKQSIRPLSQSLLNWEEVKKKYPEFLS